MAIPGLDVSELPLDRNGMRQFISDPGPGNPNVGSSGSVQAQGLRARPNSFGDAAAQSADPAVAAPKGSVFRRAFNASAGAAQTSASALKTGLGAAANVGKAMLPAALGYGAATGLRALTGTNDPGVSQPTPAYVPGSHVPGTNDQIPGVGGTAGGVPLPVEPQPMGIGGDNDFTRTTANVLNAIGPGLGGLPGNLVREGSVAARALTGARTAGLVGLGASASNPVFSPSGSDVANVTRPVAAPPIAQTAATPTPPDPTQPGSGGLGAPTGVAVTPTLDAATQGELSTAQSAAAGRVDPGTNGGGAASLGGGGAFGFGTMEDRTRQVDAGERNYVLRQGLNSPNIGTRNIAMQGIAAGDPTVNADRGIAGQEQIAGLRNQGETTRAIAANQTNRFIHGEANKVAERGQDVSLLGHRMANDVAIAGLRRQQFNADRTFDAGRLDASNAQAQLAHQNAAEAIPRVTKEFEGMLPPTGDGKPDTALAARYAQGIHAAIPALAQNITDPAKRAALLSGGLDKLDSGDKARLLAGMQLSDVANATATGGLTPWGTRAVQSNAPILAIKKLPNGDYQTNRRGVNGETEVIPGRYIEKEGSTLGLGGRATDKFKALME